jgi:hypothetical protein
VIWVLTVLVCLIGSFFCWAAIRASKSDGKYLPGRLHEPEVESVYDWAGSGDFHAYVPNREKPGQCAAWVGNRQCLMGRVMHDD